jgi:type 1 glutamine amidotransferase/sugar phosphate isomerase/epimerase
MFLLTMGTLISPAAGQTPRTTPQTPPSPAAGRVGGGRGGFTGPSISVRPSDDRLARTTAGTLLGWRLGVRTSAFGPLAFWDAAAKADAAGLAFVEGVSTQVVSLEIPKKLDYHLAPDEVDKVKARLNELRLRMPAYYAESMPGDPGSRRKLFEFAKGLGADMIVAPVEPASLAEVDKLANELAMNVAMANLGDPKGALAAVEGLSKRIGLSVDLGAWMEVGTKPLVGLAQFKDRVLAANLRDRNAPGAKSHNVTLGTGAANLAPFLLELSRLQPPIRPVDYPLPPGKDAGGKRSEVKPLFFTLDPTGATNAATDLSHAAAAYDAALPAAIRYRVDELARLTPISTPNDVPADQKQRIIAAIPRQVLVKPKKARKILVMDLCLNGGFYHGSIRLGNLSLSSMSEFTGAFTPVFSNDLDNLKYPKIKQYDAVFLNNIIGDVFADRDALDGLIRYVREGGGVAGLHAASWASTNVPEFGELMGATSGAHKYNGEPGALRVDDPNSPLTRQFDGKPFEFLDEFYHYLPTGPYSRENQHILLSMDPARKDLPGNQYTNRPDNDYGMVWIRSYGKGRVFNIGLGHRPEFYEAPKMQQMMFAGIQYVLGDLEADTTPSAKLAKK